MKTLRKSMLLILAAVFTLAIGIFAVACGGNKITLSFDWGDSQIVKVEVAPGEEVQIPAEHEREGYFFMGWFDNNSFTGTKYEGKLTAPERDTTYYARWAKGYTVTLDAGLGVNLTGGDTVLVPEGGNILEYLSGHTASKGSLTFGAWFDGDKAITESDVMPARDMTLTAKFKADYTVTVYTQTAPNKKEYAENADLSYTDKEYVGTRLNLATRTVPNYTILHDYQEGSAKTIEELEIQEDAAQNHFVLYCDREGYTIIYDSNAPQGVTVIGRMADQHFVYEEEAFVSENGYSIEGYLFAGWAQDSSGSIKYQPGEQLQNGSCTLYAIWDKGYSDMFGGTDYIYFPRLTPEKVILMRGSYEIEGTYDRSTSIATFGDDLKAKILGERFAFYSEARKATYTLVSGYYNDSTSDTTTLELDGYFGVKLSTGATGSISYNAEKGCYTLTLGGRDSDILLSKKDGKDVFIYIGSEAGTYTVYRRTVSEMMYRTEYEYTLDGAGGVVRHNLINNSTTTGSYEKPDTSLELFPIKMHFASEDVVEFLVYGEVGILKNQDHAGTYESENDGTLYLDGYNGMDQSYYTPKGGQSSRCEYYVEDTIRGTVAHVTDEAGNTYAFVITRGSGEDGKNTFAKTTAFTSYRMITLDPSSYQNVFTAFVLIIDEQEYTESGAPEHAKKAGLYYDLSIASGNDATQKPILMYEGYVEDNTQSLTEPLSKFKAVGDFKGTYVGGEESETVDDTLKSNLEKAIPYKDHEFQFHTSDQSMYGNMFYTFGEVEVDGQTEKDYVVYEEDGGNGGKLIVGAFNGAANYGMDGRGSFYVTDSGYIEGGTSVYSTNNQDVKEFNVTQYLLFQVTNPTDLTLSDMYLAAHGKQGDSSLRFEFLTEAPRFLTKALSESSTGSITENYTSLRLDGNGKAVYYRAKTEADQHTNGVEGTYNFVTTINIGSVSEQLYSFNSATISFDFVINSMLSECYNMVCERWPDGHYTLTNGDSLELDGYGSRAVYTDKYGNVIEGIYYYSETEDGNALVIGDPNNTDQQGRMIPSMYFTYDAQKNLTALTMEVQTQFWIIVDSAFNFPFAPSVLVASFDGKEVKFLDYNTGAQAATGTYDALEQEGRYVLNVRFDDTQLGNRSYTVQLGVYQQQTPYCMLQDEGTSGSYRAADNTVFELDGFGGGFLIDQNGNRTDGEYLFLDNNYVVFEDDNLEVFVIKYNAKDWTFSIVNKDQSKYRTYYAPDFTAVEFGEVLRINGESVAYWFLEGDTPVYYTRGEDGSLKKMDNFPYEYKPSDDTYKIEYEGENNEKLTVTYYLWEENKAVTLKGSIVFDYFNKTVEGQAEDGKESGKWDEMELTFTPDGTSELNAPATFKFKHGNDQVEELKDYKVVMEFPRTSSQTLHVSYLVFDTLQLRLDLKAGDNNDKFENGTFTLHAALTNDTTFIDYVHDAYGGYNYGTLYYGNYYTIGAKRWPVSNWDAEVKSLLAGKLNIFDVNGQYLTVQMNSEDAFTEENLIGTDSNLRLPIYRILTEGTDGVTYSLDLDIAMEDGYNVFLPYAICVYNEIEGENEEEGVTFIVEQLITSYVVSMSGQQYPNLGVWSCQILVDAEGTDGEGETQKKVDLLANYTTSIWREDVMIATRNETSEDEGEGDAEGKEPSEGVEATAETAEEPEYYIVWFDLDEKFHAEAGHYRAAESQEFTSSDGNIKVEALLVEDDNGNLDGFIPLVPSYKDGSEYKQAQIYDYNEEEKSFTIIYATEGQTQYTAKKIKIEKKSEGEGYTLTVEDVNLEDLQEEQEGAGA